MDSLDKDIEKVLGYKTYSDKRKVDALLEMDAILYTNLGTDSTKKERQEVKKKSRKIYKAIAELDKLWGLRFLQYLD